jgi:hypothetical protein
MVLKTGFDFNQSYILNNENEMIRKKEGVSIDECSRLCLNEKSFSCESMTYVNSFQECKWSSLDINGIDIEKSQYFISQDGYSVFLSNFIFYLRIEFFQNFTYLKRGSIIQL